MNGSSLKAALDCGWDDPEQRWQALVLVLKVLSAVERWLDSQPKGRRSESLRQYQQCQHVLGEELGVQPMPESNRQNPLFPAHRHI